MALKNLLKNKTVAMFLIVVLLVLFTAFVVWIFGGMQDNMNTRIKLETTEGDIVIELYSNMPITAGNFEKLVSKRFYDETHS